MSQSGSKARILYIEDDETIAFLTKDNLEMRGYVVDHVSDGAEAIGHFKSETYDLCLVDIMLPEVDGLTFLSKIREVNADIPVLLLTARSLTDDKIRGFSLGADDYITKPFSIDELVLRMEVFLKRSRAVRGSGVKVFRIGNTSYSFTDQSLSIGGSEVKITQRENELLNYLLNHSNQLIRREDILNSVWGDDDYFLGRSLDVFISRLRKIFADEPAILIENVHGVGFRFVTQ
ncbi:MAG: response regulator transcription factor [Bacteroidales bacterium]|nr:response regulator transcription factor [Bacteroidales bacterium]